MCHIASHCGGDVRKAMNAVELSTLASDTGGPHVEVTLEAARELTQKSTMRYDKNGDEHYDLMSAFQKSMRGSDPDATVHYLGRLLEAGDLPSVCRRCWCAPARTWPGLAPDYPVVKAAVDSALMVGLPEAAFPWRTRRSWWPWPPSPTPPTPPWTGPSPTSGREKRGPSPGTCRTGITTPPRWSARASSTDIPRRAPSLAASAVPAG